MKKSKSIILILTIFSLLTGLLPMQSLTAEAAGSQTVDIVFMHDMHSHLETFKTVQNGESGLAGGFPQIKSLIDSLKADSPDTLVVDAGDYSMGTLVQTLYDTESAELRMLGDLGVEFTTLGNHEFDYRSQGLANSLAAAKNSGDNLPTMLISNIDWASMESKGLTEEQQLLKNAFNDFGAKSYTVIQKGDTKLALFAVFGKDSLDCAPTCVLEFRDISEAAADVVKEIKANEDVDMIVCLSHSGTTNNPKTSEDEILAQNVPDIDLIVSGHSHTVLEQPIRYGDTYIVSCGEYGKNLGTLQMSQKADGRWEMAKYQLIPITADMTSDEATAARVSSFTQLVDEKYLQQFGYTSNQVLAENDIVFSTSPDLYSIHTDHNLGNLLSDAFLYAVDNADLEDDTPFTVAIVPSGCVRDTFAKGEITVADVFNSYSLGIGADKVAGYPLISLYITGAEIKMGAEIDASLSDIMSSARLYMSGVNFSFNPSRIILNKVTNTYITDRNGNISDLEDDKLYRVVCDLYSGQMLGAVNSVSKGILSIQPKYADGTPIENMEDAILTDNGKELKAWVAIADYIGSFEDTDGNGIGNVPAYYGELHGRKVVEKAKNLFDLIKHPNKFSFIIVAAVIIIILLIFLIVFLIVKLIRKIVRKCKQSKIKTE